MINHRYWITGIVAAALDLALMQLDLNSVWAKFLVGFMVGISVATVALWLEIIREWWDR